MTDTTVPSAAKVQQVDEELAKAEAQANEELAKTATPNPDGEAETEIPKDVQGDETPDLESAPKETSQVADDKGKDTEEDFDSSQLSAKAQKRYKQLVERAEKAEAELKRRQKAQEFQFTEPPIPNLDEVDKGNNLPWNAKPNDGPRQVTEEEYRKEVEEAGRRGAEKVLERERILSNLRMDSALVEERYPELNPDHTSYNQVLVDRIAGWFKQLAKDDKRLRLAKFVDEVMELRKQGSEQGKAEVSKNLAKQAAEQAVDPSGAPSSQVNNLEEQIRNAKTPEELDRLEKLLPHA